MSLIPAPLTAHSFPPQASGLSHHLSTHTLPASVHPDTQHTGYRQPNMLREVNRCVLSCIICTSQRFPALLQAHWPDLLPELSTAFSMEEHKLWLPSSDHQPGGARQPACLIQLIRIKCAACLIKLFCIKWKVCFSLTCLLSLSHPSFYSFFRHIIQCLSLHSLLNILRTLTWADILYL